MKVLRIVPVFAALAALSVNAEAGPRHHHHHHHNGGGAAVGILGAGIFLGALAATAAADSRDDAYVYDDAPPPPPPAPYYGGRGDEASEAVSACRQGMLDAARKYGAYDAEIGDIYSIRDTRFGQIVRADIRIDYRGGESRNSPVTCEIEDGILVSARSDY
jgi:hypothetical protein